MVHSMQKLHVAEWKSCIIIYNNLSSNCFWGTPASELIVASEKTKQPKFRARITVPEIPIIDQKVPSDSTFFTEVPFHGRVQLRNAISYGNFSLQRLPRKSEDHHSITMIGTSQRLRLTFVYIRVRQESCSVDLHLQSRNLYYWRTFGSPRP